MDQRERLLEFQRKADELAANKKHEALEAVRLKRTSALARLLVAHTTQSMSNIANSGVTLKPVWRPRIRDDFTRSLVLGDDFHVDNLELVASGDSSSRGYNYCLFYSIPDSSDPPEEVTVFRAVAVEHDEHISDDTKLGIHDHDSGETIPVEFDSSDYRFIRSVAGLFLPKVINDLEKVGL